MTTTAKTSTGSAHSLERALARLGRQKAPRSLLPAVLSRVGLTDRYWRLESPLGPVYVAHSNVGISMVSRASSAGAFERRFRERFGRPISVEQSVPPAGVRALVRKLKGEGRRNLRFDLRGLSEFERAVLSKALEIPSGEVRPYSWVAREIGHPEAVRATGSALAKNPVPLLIPCHRVVKSDGHIGRYSLGGSRAKRRLLQVEGAQPELLERLASSGVRVLGNADQKHFCYPTCGGIATLVLTNKVRFASAEEALAAGYHPCGDCRPASVAA
jgi:O-6-methylguanine DNA methyltransferase